MTEFWTAVAALAASISAVIAAVSTWLTYRLVVTQDEPRVVVYTSHDTDRPSAIIIRIANIGRDVASNIRFKASRPIPEQAFGMSAENAEPAAPMKDGPLIDGIPNLGPGDRRDITWGQYGGLLKAVGSQPIDVAVTYNHGKRKLRGYSRLEVSSFTGTDASSNPAVRNARSLEEIAKSSVVIARAFRQPNKRQTPEEMMHILRLWAAISGIQIVETTRVTPEDVPDNSPVDSSRENPPAE